MIDDKLAELCAGCMAFGNQLIGSEESGVDGDGTTHLDDAG